jgi:hypothetical protein
MAFKIEKFGAEVSNAKSILGGISYYRYAMTNNDDITTAGYFPSKLGLKEGDRIWVTPKTKTDADALYVVSSVSDAGVVTVVAAPSGVDESKIIIKSAEIPTADADSYGKIYCYDGVTSANYTHGYIYECQKTAITYTGTVSFEAATLSGTTVACDGDDFAQFLTEAGADPTPIVSGTLTYDAGAAGWRLVGKDAEDNTVTNFIEYNEDYADVGFTFTGTPQDGDVIAFTCTVKEDTVTYGWVRIDVQPAPEVLPDQTGQSGKFLTTNGTNASWGTINALENTATGQYSLSILGVASTFSYSVNIGIDSMVRGNHSLAVGRRAKASNSSAAIGDNSNSEFATKSTAIGCSTEIKSSVSCGVAIGYNTYSGANYAIQLGTDGIRESGGYSTVNSDANTFKVANANGNFEMMSADGTIPAARHASLPAADGTYVLKLTISGGVPTLSWVAE